MKYYLDLYKKRFVLNLDTKSGINSNIDCKFVIV